jgi:RNA polymerase sigma-70 factor (ECF subfamily)
LKASDASSALHAHAGTIRLANESGGAVNTDLVERARDGDVAAYVALARGMAPRLFRIAFRIVRDAEAAQDVMQQALIAMWRDLPMLRDAEVFEAWACRLAVNAATLRDPSRSAADRPDSAPSPGR